MLRHRPGSIEAAEAEFDAIGEAKEAHNTNATSPRAPEAWERDARRRQEVPPLEMHMPARKRYRAGTIEAAEAELDGCYAHRG